MLALSNSLAFNVFFIYISGMPSQLIKVDSISECGVSRAWVPSSDDKAFRKMQKNAWAFRLSAEFYAMKKLGWSVAFFTLTYDDLHLPHVPRICWKNPENYVPLPCFSRHDVSEFVLKLRKHLKKVYLIENFKWMICSELGDVTKRPHYHGVICWPELPHHYSTERTHKGHKIKKEWDSLPCSAQDLHSFICNTWTYGFVRPRYASGGRDSNGHDHKPFKVDGDFQFCCKYAGKYCCKDIGFYSSLSAYSDEFDVNNPFFRKLCAPFHLQTRSLGSSLLSEMVTDSQKMELLQYGFQFVGSDKYLKIPIYIRNKLLFDVNYQVDDSGKRLVRRQANEFFKDHSREIYELKSDFYESQFGKLSAGYLEGCGLDADNAYYVSSVYFAFKQAYNLNDRQFAQSYLSWYGIDQSCAFDIEPSVMWFSRYLPADNLVKDGLPLLDSDFYNDLQFVCNSVMFALGLCSPPEVKTLSEKVRHYYKECV